jgi:hypothetical protein
MVRRGGNVFTLLGFMVVRAKIIVVVIVEQTELTVLNHPRRRGYWRVIMPFLCSHRFFERIPLRKTEICELTDQFIKIIAVDDVRTNVEQSFEFRLNGTAELLQRNRSRGFCGFGAYV